jgi:hypothetical protein
VEELVEFFLFRIRLEHQVLSQLKTCMALQSHVDHGRKLANNDGNLTYQLRLSKQSKHFNSIEIILLFSWLPKNQQQWVSHLYHKIS